MSWLQTGEKLSAFDVKYPHHRREILETLARIQQQWMDIWANWTGRNPA